MKKSIRRILAIALAMGLLLGIGIPAFAAPAEKTVAAAAKQETTRDRAWRFAVLLIPILGPFIFLFMKSPGSKVPTFIVSLVSPLIGPLLFLFGVI